MKRSTWSSLLVGTFLATFAGAGMAAAEENADARAVERAIDAMASAGEDPLYTGDRKSTRLNSSH